MIYLFIFLIALFFSAFFSGVETGFIRVDPIKVYYMKDRSSRKMKQLANLIQEKEKILSLVLIGNNIFLIIVSVAVTSFLINVLHVHRHPSLLATLIVTPLLLLFGEVIPKAFFLHNPIRKISFLLPLIMFIRMLFKPFIWATDLFTRFILTHFLPDHVRTSDYLSKEDFQFLLQQLRADSDTEKKERVYLSRILRFYKTQAKEIMNPLIDVTAISQTGSIRDAIGLMTSTGYSRLPVYTDTIDSITGMIHAKDLLCQCSKDQLDQQIPDFLIKPVVYVPETKKISEILAEFQKYQHHIFIVIDEYGATAGIVSVEDVLEEIFGEIYDEYDQKNEELMYPLGKNVFILSGRLDIDIFNDSLSCNLPKHNFETIAGFILFLADRIPHQGETFHYHNFSFTVLKCDHMKIERLKLKILDSAI